MHKKQAFQPGFYAAVLVGKYSNLLRTDLGENIECGSDLVEAKWVEKSRVLEEISPLARELLPKEVVRYFSS